MQILDIIIIIIAILGVYLGYQNGIVKVGSDFVALFISMLLAGLLKGPIANMLYPVLPFLSYGGVNEELYTVNLIFYQVMIYMILVLFFLAIYQLIITKTKVKELITNTMVETYLVMKLVGAVVGAPLIILFIYNFLLFFNMPLLNLKEVRDSNYINAVLKKTPIIASVNKSLYNSEKYFNDVISDKKMLANDKRYLDNNILNYMIDEGFIPAEKAQKLIDKGLLIGYEGTNVPDDDVEDTPSDDGENTPDDDGNVPNDSEDDIPDDDGGDIIDDNTQEVPDGPVEIPFETGEVTEG